MATPNDPPKKPTGPAGQPGGGQPGKPQQPAPAKPAGQQPAKPGKPEANGGAKPPQAAMGKLVGAGKPAEKPIDNAGELKPSPEAIALVPETMSAVYKVLPLSYKDTVLTVVLGDPIHLPALDDLRNFLGIKEVNACLASPKAIAEVLSKCYAGKEE